MINGSQRHQSGRGQELIFQLALHLVVFIFYSFDKKSEQIEVHQIAFFINYALAAFTINYVLLPAFYYQKKYAHFLVSFVLIALAVIVVEEFVLEKIFFPDSRGKYFPGLIRTSLDVLPTIIILSGFKFAWDAHKKQHEVNSLQKAMKDSELQFLKSQINPHFLFNNLNNLYAYAIENSPKTPAIILELSSVLRYMLYDCREDEVLLSQELKHLQDFVALHELQIEERGKVTFQSDVMAGTYHIAPLILIVFVENAFKHSTASQSEDISIDIQIALTEDGILLFECENSYLPQANTQQLSKGIGLENVQKRLELLYPHAYELLLEKGENRYKVKLQLQLT